MAVDVGHHKGGERDFPETLGRYRLIRRISTGGMAQVFEARRESLAGVAPRVAIKVILPEHAQDMNFQRLFVNETCLANSYEIPLDMMTCPVANTSDYLERIQRGMASHPHMLRTSLM